MRKINAKANPDTLIRIEVTLKELLNISSAIDLTPPSVVIEHMKDIYGLSEDETKNVAVYDTVYGMNKYVVHELFDETHKILNEYGYELKVSDVKEPQPND